MISSNKITILGILLISVVLIATVTLMLIPDSIKTEDFYGTFTYSDNHHVTFTEDDYYSDYSAQSISKINLIGSSAESASRNVKIEGGNITILGGGTYVLSGVLDNGFITVDSGDNAEVRLVMNGAKISCFDFSAIYVKQAEKTVISLVEGTDNTISDGQEYDSTKVSDSSATAAIYSKDNLTINGKGTLNIYGNYSDGIKVNDILKITEGNISITAKDDGINVNDYIAVFGAKVNITSGGDAVKCENTDTSLGFIVLDGATVKISSEGDGIYASSAVYTNETDSSIVTGGGSQNAEYKSQGFGRKAFEFEQETDEDSVSAKAFKAGSVIKLYGGKHTIDSKDDAIHSDKDLSIDGGIFSINTGDDAIHAELNAILSPEIINITNSNEGIEAGFITVNGGNISIVSADDAINAVGENSSSFGRPMMMGRGNSEAKTSEQDIYLTINGGSIRIETTGDGIDSNGSAVINGGIVEVYGPENSGNGSIDVGDGGYVLIMNGGRLLAAGSSGMADGPYEESAQNSLQFYLDKTYPSGSVISILDENNNIIISGTSSKKFSWVCASVSDIQIEKNYSLSVNDEVIATIEATDSVTTNVNMKGNFPKW